MEGPKPHHLQAPHLRDLKRLRTPRGYLNAGLPRYNTLFGRDSQISAWEMLEVDSTIARATLDVLAEYQGTTFNSRREEEPGKILHEHRFTKQERDELPDWGFPYYGSVDSTPLFVVLANKYYERTRDRSFLRKLWPNVLAAYERIAKWEEEGGGFLRYQRKNPHGLFHQGWKDGIRDHLKIRPPVAIVEVQGYAYAAYKAVVGLARLLDEYELAARSEEKAAAFRERFNHRFWLGSESFYALGLDGENHLRKAVASNVGHLLFTGIIEEERVEAVVSRLFQRDLWTPYGIRTHSSKEPDFDPNSYHLGSVWPHDNWITAAGLRFQGYRQRGEEIVEALIRAYRALNKIPELYAVINGRMHDLSSPTTRGVPANLLQAWSIAALLSFVVKRQRPIGNKHRRNRDTVKRWTNDSEPSKG